MQRKTALQLTLAVLLLNVGILLSPRLFQRQMPPLRVVFLDVGQGDSCVIQTPKGQVMVVDTGNRSLTGQDDMGRRVVAPYLRSLGVQRIDLLLLTHPDSDHIGGAISLLEQFPVGILESNGQDTRPLQNEVVQQAKQRYVTLHHAAKGEDIELDGVRVQVLAPLSNDTQEPTNSHSIVLRLTYGESSLLLTGDAERDEEAHILQSGNLTPTQLLKVGHHGSLTSTTEAFLSRVAPRIAVISVGKHNRYGHPHPQIMERLKRHEVQVFRTDTQGAITCTSDTKGWKCEPYTRLPQ